MIKNREIHDVLLYLIQYFFNLSLEPNPARGIHFVLISRLDPAFPLSRWRVNKQICEIRSADLRFSFDETSRFLSQRAKTNLSPEQVRALETKTEGWIAGLQLASYSLQGLSSDEINRYIKNFTGNNRYIADYLMEEVMEQQTPEIKDFLLRTSILEKMNAQLCDAVLNINGSQAILENLDRSNLFLVPLDDQRAWYRYHQLFSDLLQNRLSLFSQVDIQSLHRRAAAWLEENDLMEEALKHWLQAEDYEAASSLIEKFAPHLMSTSKFFFLRSLIERFPEQAFDKSPWLNIYRAWVNFILQPEAVELWLEKTLEILDKESQRFTEKQRADILGNLVSVKAICAARRGDFEETFINADAALSYLEPQDYKVRGLVLYAQATAKALKGDDLADALYSCHEAEKMLNLGGNYAAQVDALSLSGEINLMLGKLHDAADLFNEAIHFSDHKENVYSSAAMSYTGLGEVLYEWNQLELAFKYLQRGCELGEQWGISQWVSSFCSLAMAYLGVGDIKNAIDAMKQYEQRSRGQPILVMSQSRETACKLHLYSTAGDQASLEKIIEERALKELTYSNLVREPEWIALASIYYAQRKWNDVIRIADLLLPAMKAGKRFGRWIKMAAMSSVAYRMSGQKETASALFAELLPRAKSEGFLRTFCELKEPMLEWIVEYTHDEKMGKTSSDLAYLNQIVSVLIGQKPAELTEALPQSSSESPGIQNEFSLLNKLSEHEIKVLRLLSVGFSNRDIAEELGISINTVKTHCANIYGKLGVHNRGHAVNRAKLMKIIPSRNHKE